MHGLGPRNDALRIPPGGRARALGGHNGTARRSGDGVCLLHPCNAIIIQRVGPRRVRYHGRRSFIRGRGTDIVGRIEPHGEHPTIRLDSGRCKCSHGKQVPRVPDTRCASRALDPRERYDQGNVLGLRMQRCARLDGGGAGCSCAIFLNAQEADRQKFSRGDHSEARRATERVGPAP